MPETVPSRTETSENRVVGIVNGFRARREEVSRRSPRGPRSRLHCDQIGRSRAHAGMRPLATGTSFYSTESDTIHGPNRRLLQESMEECTKNKCEVPLDGESRSPSNMSDERTRKIDFLTGEPMGVCCCVGDACNA